MNNKGFATLALIFLVGIVSLGAYLAHKKPATCGLDKPVAVIMVKQGGSK